MNIKALSMLASTGLMVYLILAQPGIALLLILVCFCVFVPEL